MSTWPSSRPWKADNWVNMGVVLFHFQAFEFPKSRQDVWSWGSCPMLVPAPFPTPSLFPPPPPLLSVHHPAVRGWHQGSFSLILSPFVLKLNWNSTFWLGEALGPICPHPQWKSYGPVPQCQASKWVLDIWTVSSCFCSRRFTQSSLPALYKKDCFFLLCWCSCRWFFLFPTAKYCANWNTNELPPWKS